MSLELNPSIEPTITKETAWKEILRDPWKNLIKVNSRLESNHLFQELKQWCEAQVDKLPDFEIDDKATLENEDWVPVYSSEDDDNRGC